MNRTYEEWLKYYENATKEQVIEDMMLDIKEISRLNKNNQAMQEEMARTWQECDDYKSKVEKIKKILNANTYIENIYHALCNLFDEEYQYEIDNEELNNILQGRKDEM